MCRRTDSNRHELLGSQVFETCVSTIPPLRRSAKITTDEGGIANFGDGGGGAGLVFLGVAGDERGLSKR